MLTLTPGGGGVLLDEEPPQAARKDRQEQTSVETAAFRILGPCKGHLPWVLKMKITRAEGKVSRECVKFL